MLLRNRIADWLETRYVNPAYAGWLLGAIALCFFGAATNTMAGWLYVMSGIIFAMLGLAAILPKRTLKLLQVRRNPILPVSVGDQLSIELEIANPTTKPKTLLQVQDILQSELATPVQTSVELIKPQSTHRSVYYHPTQKRGVFRWHEVQIRTATPLGLFWCRRSWNAPALAIVYPTVLPLTVCPIVDEMGREDSKQFYSDRRSNSATEDLTRSLRPYRIGDPTRLIHWRTSARLGELQVRELEVFTGSQDVIICLDSASKWNYEDFEQAVIAAASLYFYALRCQFNVKLWTAKTGLLHGNSIVLETLAATTSQEDAEAGDPPDLPLILLTQNPVSLDSLSSGSRWIFWQPTTPESGFAKLPPLHHGLVIDSTQSLQSQLQQPLH